MAMEERKGASTHKVIIDERDCTTIEGVNEVISFDEESIICETNMGTLTLKGNGLHVEKLNLDQGLLSVNGEVESVEYSEPGTLTRGGGGLLGRIFK